MNRADPRYLPLTPDVVGEHLRGDVHIGLYDFDKEAAMLDALAYMKAARSYDIPAALEAG